MTRLSFAVTNELDQHEEVEIALKELDAIGPRNEKFSLAKESLLLLGIAMPAVAVQFSVLFIFPQTASSTIGRNLGTEELAGFSLASLTGNLTILSVMVGALSAADTLMPRLWYGELQGSRSSGRSWICHVHFASDTANHPAVYHNGVDL